MGYAIICDARKGTSLGINVLALVDRAKTKKLWWTSDNTYLILNYQKKEAALFSMRRLQRNNARVVRYEDAVRTIKFQSNDIVHQQAMDDLEMGWDSHKGVF